MKYEFHKIKLSLIKENTLYYNKQLTCKGNILDFMNNVIKIQEEAEEVLILITCDTKLNVNGYFEVSRGTINATIAMPREIFKRLVLNNSSSFFMVHNHLTGDVTPSSDDVNIYNKINELSKLCGIDFIDNIIVSEENIYSFRENHL